MINTGKNRDARSTLKRAQITPNWVNFTQKEQNVPKRLKKTENPQEQKLTL